MRTYETKEKTIKQTFIKSITCDQCKKEIKLIGGYEHYKAGVDLRISAGFGSRFDSFMDGDERVYDICDNCCETLLKSFGFKL